MNTSPASRTPETGAASSGQLLLVRYLLPIRPARTVLEHQAVVIDPAGRISEVLGRAEALQRHAHLPRVDLDRHVLLPGLINMHTHSPMSLLRGLADDLALDDWLRLHIWPAETRHLGAEFVQDGTRLALLEMLRAGTTCFNEMYFFPDLIAQCTVEAGMRARLGVPVIDVPTPWAGGISDCLAHARDLHAELAGLPGVDLGLAPHALYTVNDEGLAAVRELSLELGLPVAMHLLEAEWEIGHSLREYKELPLQRLQRHELLNPQFTGVHMVHVDAAGIAVLAAAGVHVAHCPESNLKLANGICPASRMLAAGVNVTLGTDGAASNNNLDLLAELRTACLLAKVADADPRALNAWQALDLVTVNAAHALGLDREIGTIEAGKFADLCALDLEQPETQPLHQVHSQLVYAANSRQFTDVWVGGRRLLQDGCPTTLDGVGILGRAREWRERLVVGAT